MKSLKLIFLFIIILCLNLIWEFSHYGLYIDLTGIPSTNHIIIASFTDLLIISFILLINSVYNKNIKWLENPKNSDFVIIVLIGFLLATIIEVYSLSKGRWLYTEYMPTIFGIGLSPLIQLFTTSIISFILLKVLK